MDGQPAPQHSSAFDVTQFFWLLLVSTMVAMGARWSKVPYALALVITGLLIGIPHLLPQAHLDPHTLFTVFLPPLLFESAVNVRIEPLRRNWKIIATYALGGTLISTFVVGGLTHWLLRLPLPVALVFGAIVSSTDPISVIAVFKRLGVGKRLSLLVEAESLFNDGAAVVLFGVLLEFALGGKISVAGAVQQFLVVVLGGAAVGAGLGALASRITREFDDHLLEIMLTTVVAFGAYLCAEAVHVSGVIAVVVAGLLVGNWGMQTGMSPTTRLAVASFWEYAAFIVNSFVFLLLGIEVTVVNLWSGIGAVAVAVLAVLAGRSAAVYGLSPLVNWAKGGVPFRWQHILVWGGLRGALSVALALGLDGQFPRRGTLVVLTFGVVLFSLLGQGLTIGSLLRKLGLSERPTGAADHERLVGETLTCDAAIAELERLASRGVLPRATCAEVTEEYRSRLVAVEERLDALLLSSDELRERQLVTARRQALLAEKTALLEAEREGMIDSAMAEELLHAIDGRLDQIQPESHA